MFIRNTYKNSDEKIAIIENRRNLSQRNFFDKEQIEKKERQEKTIYRERNYEIYDVFNVTAIYTCHHNDRL